MITLEWGVYFMDAMQKLSEKIHGGVIGTYAVVTKIWMPKWCSLKRERHPGSCGLTKNGLHCKIKKNENKMVYYEKRAPPCIMWPTKMAFDVDYTEFLL